MAQLYECFDLGKTATGAEILDAAKQVEGYEPSETDGSIQIRDIRSGVLFHIQAAAGSTAFNPDDSYQIIGVRVDETSESVSLSVFREVGRKLNAKLSS